MRKNNFPLYQVLYNEQRGKYCLIDCDMLSLDLILKCGNEIIAAAWKYAKDNKLNCTPYRESSNKEKLFRYIN